MAIEDTRIFVKSHKIDLEREITQLIFNRLFQDPESYSFGLKGIVQPPREFYEEFYASLKKIKDLKPSFQQIIDSYVNTNNGKISISVISGENIIKRVRKIIGPTRYEDNIGRGTIREIFGPYELPNTICHAPANLAEAEHDKEVFEKFGLI